MRKIKRDDSDDKLLHRGVGVNSDHLIAIKERLFEKSFLPSFCSDNTPRDKFHYTSPEGLMGILRTRTFFFTDSQFLNDYREKLNINDEVSKFWCTNKKKYEKDFFRLLNHMRVNGYEDIGFSYNDSKTCIPCRYFVLSLSMCSDSLSMWKYYSKNGSYNGYCIGLFDYALDDEWIDRTTGVAVIASKVEYYSNDKQRIIADTVDRLYSIWQSYNRSEELDEKIVMEYMSWLNVEALLFKDECFSEEQESRYIAVVPTDKLRELHYTYKEKEYNMYDFRINNGVLIPYIKVPFNEWNVDACWVINSITVGPCYNAEERMASIKMFIDSLDYKFKDCSICKSIIPVRY